MKPSPLITAFRRLAAITLLTASALVANPLFTWTAHAQTASPNFSGKTVTIVIGFGLGGEFGEYSRLAATYMGKHIAGNPNIIVQAMPGGGGKTSLIYLERAAAKDGTVLTLAPVSIVQEALLESSPGFTISKFRWIGRFAGVVQTGIVSAKSGVKSLEDAKRIALTAGSPGVLFPPALNPRILNAFAGTKFKIVTGYKSTQDVQIAWERGEVDVLTASWDTIRQRFGRELAERTVIPLYAYSMEPQADLKGVPSIVDAGRNEDEKAFLRIYSVGTAIGRSLAAPPDVPDAVVKAWREAFDKMLRDADFRAAVEKGNVRLSPLPGDEMESLVKSVLATPTSQVEQARKIYNSLIKD